MATNGPEVGADKAERARDRILAAAADLFYREGIRAVGVDAVVEQAGCTKMSLYRSFASKDELVAAVLAEKDRLYWRWWEGVVARHPGDPRAQVSALFASVAKLTTKPGYRGCPFVNTASELADWHHPGRSIVAANKKELRRRLTALAADLGAGAPAALADQLALVLEGAYASSQTFGPSGPAAAAPAAAAALIKAARGS